MTCLLDRVCAVDSLIFFFGLSERDFEGVGQVQKFRMRFKQRHVFAQCCEERGEQHDIRAYPRHTVKHAHYRIALVVHCD